MNTLNHALTHRHDDPRSLLHRKPPEFTRKTQINIVRKAKQYQNNTKTNTNDISIEKRTAFFIQA